MKGFRIFLFVLLSILIIVEAALIVVFAVLLLPSLLIPPVRSLFTAIIRQLASWIAGQFKYMVNYGKPKTELMDDDDVLSNGVQINKKKEGIEPLIDAALTDGVLSEKEKKVLFKRARSMGYKKDEFELLLNARLYKLNHPDSSPKKDLEQLVDAALIDGVLTQKEKEVLCKKARSMGYEENEFELLLNARRYKFHHPDSSPENQQLVLEE